MSWAGDEGKKNISRAGGRGGGGGGGQGPWGGCCGGGKSMEGAGGVG